MLSQEAIDWLRLILTPEIGPRRGKSLLERFKTPKAILEACLGDIAEVENVGRAVAEKIVEGRKNVDIERQIKLIEKNNVRLIPVDSGFYPSNLKSIFDPPLVLFVRGEILPQDYFSIAIVGTRLASFYGRSMAEKLSSQLAEKGFTVVSGGARGIDTFSHQSALKMRGRTLAVLGCGLDISYPPENKRLFEEIAQKGAMISEFPLSAKPDRGNFPMRNRIISGLSLGVVVIEAPHKSGALITVTHANEQGREVFSVPGQANSFLSKGTNQLLREGAKLVESADDIIEELEPVLRSKVKEFKINYPEPERKEQISAGSELIGEEAKVYSMISGNSVGLDGLIEKTDLDISKISDILLRLQLKKMIRQLPGKQFVRS
ncbi:MAG: DNA-processing protein DprA [Candidatus Omnitrophica bacterium]|nr:DNA-processing protein DprA [Candidatus Omnitrophota bacterium]